MTRTDSDRLRRDLRKLVAHAETTLQRMADAAGDHADETALDTNPRQHRSRLHLEAVGHGAVRARTAGKHTRHYVREHPWIVFGGFVALMVVAGALARGRL